MHTIHKKPGFLLVTLEGEATYHDFKSAIDEELARDDYPDMNDVWDLDHCLLSVGHDQLENIVNDVLHRYPRQASRSKTALVASSGITRAIVHFWIERAEILPYEKRIFLNLQEAEGWIAEPGVAVDAEGVSGQADKSFGGVSELDH